MNSKKAITSLWLLITCATTTTLHAGTEGSTDTSFKRTNPNLLYTTRDYYIAIPDDCYTSGLCLNEFSLILRFNIGVDSKQSVKQIGFHSAYLDFNSKATAAATFITQDFSKYSPISSQDGWKVQITFYPDQKGTAPKGVVQKCVFDGLIQQKGVSGKLTFYMAGGTYEFSIL